MGTAQAIFVVVERGCGATGTDRVRMLDRKSLPGSYVTGGDITGSGPDHKVS
jgi:hypothetical protein